MSRYARFFGPDTGVDLVREAFAFDGIDISTLRSASPNSEATCIVLHGGGGNASLVAPVAEALVNEGFDAVAPDLPGYGLSEVPPRAFRYDTWVAAVAALAERESDRGRRPVVTLGLSMGGLLGYHAACRTKSVVGVVATNLLDPSDPSVMRAVARNPLMARTTGLLAPPLDGVRVPIRWLCRMDRISNDAELVRACLEDPRGAGLRVPLGFLRTWFGYTPEREPEDFDRPVLLAHPGDDRWTPTATSLRFFDRLGGPKRFVELEGCGHAPVEEPGRTTLRREAARFCRDLAT